MSIQDIKLARLTKALSQAEKNLFEEKSKKLSSLDEIRMIKNRIEDLKTEIRKVKNENF